MAKKFTVDAIYLGPKRHGAAPGDKLMLVGTAGSGTTFETLKGKKLRLREGEFTWFDPNDDDPEGYEDPMDWDYWMAT